MDRRAWRAMVHNVRSHGVRHDWNNLTSRTQPMNPWYPVPAAVTDGEHPRLRLWCEVSKERVLLYLQEPQMPLKPGNSRQENTLLLNVGERRFLLRLLLQILGGTRPLDPGHLSSQTSQWRLWSNPTQFDVIISSILQHKCIPHCMLVAVCLRGYKSWSLGL